MNKSENKNSRPLYEIAEDIRKDWKNVYFGALPYLEVMHSLKSIEDSYYQESARSIVNYFLANAQTWRGEVARAIKQELKAML